MDKLRILEPSDKILETFFSEQIFSSFFVSFFLPFPSRHQFMTGWNNWRLMELCQLKQMIKGNRSKQAWRIGNNNKNRQGCTIGKHTIDLLEQLANHGGKMKKKKKIKFYSIVEWRRFSTWYTLRALRRVVIIVVRLCVHQSSRQSSLVFLFFLPASLSFLVWLKLDSMQCPRTPQGPSCSPLLELERCSRLDLVIKVSIKQNKWKKHKLLHIPMALE